MHSTVLEAFAIYSKVLFVMSLLCMYMYSLQSIYSFILEIQLKYVGNMKNTQHAINRIIMIVMKQSHAIAITLKIAQPYLLVPLLHSQATASGLPVAKLLRFLGLGI